ncbi:hypothetical protein V8G54_019965 [Vigna mungo]|uniref:Uncharacterized protein n=1 Tax=Vigna mungo TaxID=3915 RepID=A0AAQ3RVZ6_VIGMU
MVILIVNIYKISQPNTLQACKFIILVTIKQATEQIMRHHINLAEPHGPLINLPQHKGRRSVGKIAHSSKHKHLLTCNQEGEHSPMRPKGVNLAPNPMMQVKRRNKARVYPKDIKFPFEEGRRKGRGGVS